MCVCVYVCVCVCVCKYEAYMHIYMNCKSPKCNLSLFGVTFIPEL